VARPSTDGSGPVKPVARPAVELIGVTKSFGRTQVLKGINLSVSAGELVEIVGPSGAGKTTLLRLIHGQLRPGKGEVRVRGRRLHRWWRSGVGRIRREVAYVFQEQRLLPRLTALENLVFALQVRDPQIPRGDMRRRAMAALQSLGLGNRGKAYPDQLSAGERQRLAVARALASRPRVLLADEPLNSIDEDNARIVMRLLEEAAANGTAVIVASHRSSFQSSRILRLPAGTVVNGRGANSNGSGARPSMLRQLIAPARMQIRTAGRAQGALANAGRAQGALNGNGHNGSAHNGSAHNGSHNGSRTNGSANGAAHNGSTHKRKARAEDNALPWWRRQLAFFANSYRLVVLSGLRSWRRDMRLTAPALGSMALVLILCGMLAFVGIAVAQVAGQQAGQASVLRVFLAADATPDQVAALTNRLQADPRVASITPVSADQAMQDASNRPGLDQLASLSASNPFLASLDLQLRRVTDIASVASSVQTDPAVDQSYPTSYDPDTYARLRKIALIVGAVGAGLVLLFAAVAYAVVANSARGIVAARREELAVTRLLGARGWMLRGPFVVEGVMTGALAGALAGGVAAGAYLLATRFALALYTQVLPGVGPMSVRYVVAAIIVTGIVLGALTSGLGFRRVRA
jgi:ABC-type ATPase involved in cell division/cell division protein FtsX